MTRELFDAFDRTDKAHAYELIDATKHPLFFKFILNFDAKKEDIFKDLDLQHITRKTLREMERLIGRDVPFVAVMHDDHTDLRHIHAIGMVQGKIAKADFQKLKTLRLTATAEARALRRQRDRVREHPRVQFLTQARVRSRSQSLHQTAVSIHVNRFRCSMAAITAATEKSPASPPIETTVPAATSPSTRRKRSTLN